MTKKVLKGILGIIIFLLLIITIIIFYYLMVDRQTQQPKQVQEQCNIETKLYKNNKVFIVTPKDNKNYNINILYFHGGSYMAEATEQHWDFIEKIVLDTGATVILPDYPLAPKNNYKDVFEMVEPLYKEIIKKIDTNSLIIMGDSAGGGLGLALTEKLTQEDIELPNKTILISPWLDVRLTNEKIDEIQKNDKDLNKQMLQLAGSIYAGTDGINNYLVNPIDGDLSKLKNVTIFTGTSDILNPDTHVLQEKAKKVNLQIDIKEYEGAGHIWVIQKGENEELENQGYKDILETIIAR